MRPTTFLRFRRGEVVLGPVTRVMGVLNVTPDSFSDGGAYLDPDAAVRRGLQMAADGADILDVGGESTRPGAEPVGEADELRRVLRVVTEIRRRSSIPISIDTTKAVVARAALDEGADIVNDVGALRFDPDMAGTVARAGAAVVLMHMQGVPRTMQAAPAYGDVVAEVAAFLAERAAAAEAAGIPADRIAVDPGIGFGKTAEHNLILLDRIDAIAAVGRPVVVGVSRKAFLGRILGRPPLERLEGTLAASVLAAARGARILRVHDVAEARRALDVADAILNEGLALPSPRPEAERHAG